MGLDFARYMQSRLKDDYETHKQEIQNYENAINEQEGIVDNYYRALTDILKIVEGSTKRTSQSDVDNIKRIVDDTI